MSDSGPISDTSLTSPRAAEITTGLICVCCPPLAILAHRHGPQKPTRSILNGESGSRSTNLSGRRRPTSTDEEILFDKGDMELQHRDTVHSSTMVTGVVGGARTYKKKASFEIQESTLGDREGGVVSEDHIAGIMRTVRVEQTYM